MFRLTSAILCLILSTNAAEPVKEPELRAELLRRAKADQDFRGAITKWLTQFDKPPGDVADIEAFEASLNEARKAEYQKLKEEGERIDAENTLRLGEIVERHGWPTQTLVGKDGANAAWLLVQHADHAPAFQRKCLDLMAKLPSGVSRKDVAYLTDRVLLAEGKKQVYGTQITLTDGKCVPRPLEDEANVDKRRQEVGLEPLAEYLQSVESFYRPKK